MFAHMLLLFVISSAVPISVGGRFHQADESVPGPIRVSGNLLASHLVYYVEPVHPEDAKHARVAGLVILLLTVSEKGLVQDVRLARGHPFLNDAAIEAVRQWLYNPIIVRGKPVSVIGSVAIAFPPSDAQKVPLAKPIGLLLQMDEAGAFWADEKTRLEGEQLVEAARQAELVGPVFIVPHAGADSELLKQTVTMLLDAGVANVVVGRAKKKSSRSIPRIPDNR